LGPLLKKRRELGGTWFINKACILYKRLLGKSAVLQVQLKLRLSQFSQIIIRPRKVLYIPRAAFQVITRTTYNGHKIAQLTSIQILKKWKNDARLVYINSLVV
jgi:hypothetical protein